MKVLVVDDHPLIRTGVRGMLSRHDGACDIAEAEDCGSAIALLANGDVPDLILLDLNLPDCSGLAALDAVRAAAPSAPVVVLSAEEDKNTILDALNRGAMGFIPKSMNPDLVWSALGLVLAGGIYVPHTVVAGQGSGASGRGSKAASDSVPSLASLGLTERQIDTLRMLVKGMPNKTIARHLGISEATVKVYVSAALRAMNVTSRTQAVIWLARHGISIEDKPGAA